MTQHLFMATAALWLLLVCGMISADGPITTFALKVLPTGLSFMLAFYVVAYFMGWPV